MLTTGVLCKVCMIYQEVGGDHYVCRGNDYDAVKRLINGLSGWGPETAIKHPVAYLLVCPFLLVYY